MCLKSPCLPCQERNVTAVYNCHDHCPKYLAYRQALDAQNEMIRQRSISFVSVITGKDRRR